MPGADALLLYGANGATGRRIVELAVGAGLRPVVAGRRRDALAEIGLGHQLEIRTAEAEDIGTVLDGIAVVVSCLPAYSVHGLPVVRAAVEAGVHYVDCSGEPAFLQHVVDHFDAPARRSGAVLVPAAGLGVASNLAVDEAARGLGAIQRVRTVYRFHDLRPSVGTLRSSLVLMAGPVMVFDGPSGRFVPSRGRVRRLSGGFGLPFPSNDPVMIHRSHPSATIESYLVSPVAPLAAPLLPAVSMICRHRSVVSALENLAGRRKGARAEGARGRIDVAVTVEGEAGQRTVATRVANVYDFTALVAFQAARRLLAADLPAGVHGPTELVDREALGLQTLPRPERSGPLSRTGRKLS